jgi:hypothetical protein
MGLLCAELVEKQDFMFQDSTFYLADTGTGIRHTELKEFKSLLFKKS